MSAFVRGRLRPSAVNYNLKRFIEAKPVPEKHHLWGLCALCG
jgi:hypothetical protein